MPQLMTDWHAKEKRITDRLRVVRMKQDALRAEADRLTAELGNVQALASAHAPKCRHDFRDGDICSRCDQAKAVR